MPGLTKNRFLLLYGSQTGQAKAISEEICERAENEGLHADICCLGQTEKKFNIEKERCVVIVISTTGDGEPPDTASKFVRRLKKKTLPDDYLSKLNYTLLGLGDSNYTNFCNCGKGVDRRLEELGAKRFYPCAWADDAVGLEVAVEPWIDGLWASLREFLGVPVPSEKSTEEVTDRVDCSLMSHKNTDTVNNIVTDADEQAKHKEAKPVENTSEMEKIFNNMEGSLPKKLEDLALHSSIQPSEEVIDTIDANVNQNYIFEQSSNSVREKNNNANTSNNAAECISPMDIKTDDTSGLPKLSPPSLRKPSPVLADSGLTLPALPPCYLKCVFKEEKVQDTGSTELQNGCPFPSAASAVSMATVKKARILTKEDAVKTTLFLTLSVQDQQLQYEPGDAVSIICQNDPDEVESLLERLGVKSQADCELEINVIPGTKKKNAAVPPHIPPETSLRHILLTCLDIRDQPKKALLRCFVECTEDDSEKRRLQELCSRQGGADYSAYIREPRLSLLDILNAFPSCQPSVERLLEHLPRLQPRPYSVCSSQMVRPGELDIAFNVVNIPVGEGRAYPRSGICTGWLDTITKAIQVEPGCQTEEQNPEEHEIQIPVFTRTSQHFRCPDNVSTPMILIGPGTGVAPFIGFLQHRLWQSSNTDQPIGQVMLFYGCRHCDRDYLFREELEEFKKSGVLSQLFVSFSRDDRNKEDPKYVQDNVRQQGENILHLIENENAVMFVCGDARNMAKDVNKTFIEILEKHKGLSESEAGDYMMRMRLHKTYLEDVWS